MMPLSETAKSVIKMVAGFLGVVGSAGMTAILAAGQDNFRVFFERPSVLLGMMVAGVAFIQNSLSKGPQESRAIDAERQAKVEEKVATMTGKLYIPPRP